MRKQGKCSGDCAKCELLRDGEVDMIPCILDQMFQRVQKIESSIKNMGAGASIAEAPEM